MVIKDKNEIIKSIKKFKVDTEYLIVKPNWVSNSYGEYTESEVLDWILDSFPNQKKIILESYTPWRGQTYAQNPITRQEGDDQLAVTLEGGIDYWQFYKDADIKYLSETGNDKILKKHNAEYINITNEFWANRCTEPELIRKRLPNINFDFLWPEFLSYIPSSIFKLKDKATFLSLAKIKQEPCIPEVAINLSAKNLFGLIPSPSRWIPYHNDNHKMIPRTIAEINYIYNSIFRKNLWINEGIKTSVRYYCEDKQTVDQNLNLFFIEESSLEVDKETCRYLGLDPCKLMQLQTLEKVI